MLKILAFVLTLYAIHYISGYTYPSDKLISPIPETTPSPEPTRTPVTPTPTPEPDRVSWYGQEYCDKYSPACITASGEKFDDSDFTCACGRDIPLGTRLRVTYQDKSVVVRCNDRGSFQAKYGRSLDLAKAAFAELAPLSTGVIKVEIQVL